MPQSVSLEAVEFASLDLLLCLSRHLVGAVQEDSLRCDRYVATSELVAEVASRVQGPKFGPLHYL